jgi:hypothetical protein
MPDNKTTNEVRRGRVIFFAGLALLLVGLLLTLYNFATGRLGAKQTASGIDQHTQEQIQKFQAELAGAEPRFEIGYTRIRLNLFKELQAKKQDANQGVTELLAYPIVSNEVETRIKTNSPPVEPDFVNLPLRGDDLRDFKSLSRRKKVKLREVNVVCLVVKQVGKGKAENVVLTAEKSYIDGGVYIFDYTELGWGDEGGDGTTGAPQVTPEVNREAAHKFELGTMDTGSAFIIPLYLTNLFERLDGGTEPPGFEIVSGTVFRPAVVHYKKAGGETITQVPLTGMYTLPLVIQNDN